MTIHKILLWLLLLVALAIITQKSNAQTVTFACSKVASLTTTSSGAQAITGLGIPASGKTYRICAVYFQVIQGAAAANFGLVSGTGSNCGTGQANLTVQWTGTSLATQGIATELPANTAMFAPTNAAVCLNLSAAPTSANVQVHYEVE